MENFHDSQYRYSNRDKLMATNQLVWQHIAQRGNWWKGAERIAIAREARACENAKNKSVKTQNSFHYPLISTDSLSKTELPEIVVNIVRYIINDPTCMRDGQSWLENLKIQGVSHAHYVELLSVVVFVINIDTFHRALGIPLMSLPSPVPGPCSQYTPIGLTSDEAWVPMLKVPVILMAQAGLYKGKSHVNNILRALSVIPEAMRMQCLLERHYYLKLSLMMDYKSNDGRSLSRLQMELIALRVSVHNRSFYCTIIHGLFLKASAELINYSVALEDVFTNKPVSQPIHVGIAFSKEILNFTDAVLIGDINEIKRTRGILEEVLPIGGITDASAVIGSTQSSNRIANFTGIKLGNKENLFSLDLQYKYKLRHYPSASSTPFPNIIVRTLMKIAGRVIFGLLFYKDDFGVFKGVALIPVITGKGIRSFLKRKEPKSQE
ncbi:MAG: alkylhydroperoxidase-related (seleno)protein [Bermanella sp.]